VILAGSISADQQIWLQVNRHLNSNQNCYLNQILQQNQHLHLQHVTITTNHHLSFCLLNISVQLDLLLTPPPPFSFFSIPALSACPIPAGWLSNEVPYSAPPPFSSPPPVESTVTITPLTTNAATQHTTTLVAEEDQTSTPQLIVTTPRPQECGDARRVR